MPEQILPCKKKKKFNITHPKVYFCNQNSSYNIKIENDRV